MHACMHAFCRSVSRVTQVKRSKRPNACALHGFTANAKGTDSHHRTAYTQLSVVRSSHLAGMAGVFRTSQEGGCDAVYCEAKACSGGVQSRKGDGHYRRHAEPRIWFELSRFGTKDARTSPADMEVHTAWIGRLRKGTSQIWDPSNNRSIVQASSSGARVVNT